MKKEQVLVVIVGLFLLSYVLDATVKPLTVGLATPYHYLNPEIFTRYPFTSASIVVKALAIFLTPLFLLSFSEGHNSAKGAGMLVLIALMQLYALQDIATGAKVVPVEWALSISVAGIALGVPMAVYFVRGALDKLHGTLGGKKETPEEPEENEE